MPRTEAVEADLNRLIERRASAETDPEEREELWKESVRRYNEHRREENRLAWCATTSRTSPALSGPGRMSTTTGHRRCCRRNGREHEAPSR